MDVLARHEPFQAVVLVRTDQACLEHFWDDSPDPNKEGPVTRPNFFLNPSRYGD